VAASWLLPEDSSDFTKEAVCSNFDSTLVADDFSRRPSVKASLSIEEFLKSDVGFVGLHAQPGREHAVLDVARA